MHKIFLTVLALVALTATARADGARPAHTLLHILDYVAVDYPGVVRDGRILNPAEYREQQEFAGQLGPLVSRLPEGPAKAEIDRQARRLAELIDVKAPGDQIAALCKRLSVTLIDTYAIKTAPETAPPLDQGARLYAENCTDCHGALGFGDGPNAVGLDPAPADFHDRARQADRSLYSLYSTITLGVEGTAMPSFTQFSEAERWALAFHVGNYFAKSEERTRGEALWQDGGLRQVFPDLGAVTAVTPGEIRARYGDDAVALFTFLRASPEVLGEGGGRAALAVAQAKLQASLAAYRGGDTREAYDAALAAYLQGFELAEAGLRISAPELREEVERKMAGYREAIQQGVPVDTLAVQAAEIERLLVETGERLGEGTISGVTGAVGAFLLLLREGVEAILVLAAIFAFLTRTERQAQMRYVHAGWLGALIAGVLTWFAAAHFISVSGADREMTEGVTALLAAVMLIYVGYWLHNNSHAQRWKAFLAEKLNSPRARRSVWTLVAISFLAVYREVFETILFFQTLWLQVAGSERGLLVGGVAAAAVVLGVLAWAVFRLSVRLPVRLFFQVNAVLLYGLAVVFTGKGIAALQEAGVFPINTVAAPDVDLLGIHPSVEGLAAQTVLLAAGLAWVIYRRLRPGVANAVGAA